MKKQMQKQTDNQNLKRQILLNNLVNQLLQNQMQSNTKHSDINLMELSDLFIWCEKKNPQLLRSIIEMDVIKKILQSQNDLELEIRSFVLLVNNCKLNGDIIIYLLANQIVDQVITKYIYSLKKDQKIDQQQKLEYLGSLLKAYNMHLNQKTFPYYKFKGKGQSLLVKICTRFYNCPQQLTRTSVMNILMNILKSDFSSELIYVDGKICYCIQQWCRNLCCQFRNQLKDINQKLFVVKDNQIQEIIQEINDKIVLWQDLSQTIPQLFQLYFKQQVILPLVVGSLNTLSLPMFNIKFSFFILAKLMKVMSNFGLMQDLGDVFLGQKNIKYKDSSVSTAVLKGFDLKYILNDQYYKVSQQNDDQAHSFLGTHEFFKNMLKSKDPHFLQIGCNFLQQIIAVALKNQSSCKKYYLNSLGISNNGFIIKTFTQILLNQFRYDHPLSLIVKLCQIISYIQKPGKYFSEDSLNIFVFVFRQLLVQALQMIQNNSQHWDYISQIYEYDLRTIKQISLQPKIKKDKDLLLSEDQNQNESAFYQKIPQIPCQYLRYKITKVILLKKFKMRITQCKQQNQIQKYIQRIDQWDSKTKKSGQFLYFPLKMKYFHCQILQDKLKVACLQLDDEVYFTLGFIEETHVKIMMNLKMKHISTEIIQKKDKHLLQLTVRKYSFAKQNLQVKSKILLRGLQNGSQYIAIKKMQLQQKQINNITKMIKRTLQQLPKISLI